MAEDWGIAEPVYRLCGTPDANDVLAWHNEPRVVQRRQFARAGPSLFYAGLSISTRVSLRPGTICAYSLKSGAILTGQRSVSTRQSRVQSAL